MTVLSYFDFVVVVVFFQAFIRDHDYCGEKRYMVQNTKKCNCTTQQTRFGMKL